MIERLLAALVLIAAGVVAYQVFVRMRLARPAIRDLGLVNFEPGRPAILFFSGDGCASCHTIQKPALDELALEYDGQLQVLEFDALLRSDLADHWGVLSLPTTFVIDRRGRPRRVNHGPARADRLRTQLAEIGEAAPAQAGGSPPRRSVRSME